MSARPPTRILVAEDDPDIGNLLEHYLRKAGFTATVITIHLPSAVGAMAKPSGPKFLSPKIIVSSTR